MIASAETVTKGEAAKLLGVHRNTVTNWLAAGEIREDADGRIPVSEIERKARDWQPVAELDVVRATQNAAEYLTGWFDAQTLNARIAVIGAAQQLVAAYGDAKSLKDRQAAEIVLGERLDNIDAAIASVAVAIDQIRALSAVRPMVVDVRGEAAKVAREWDARTASARKQVRRDRAAHEE